MGRGGEAAMVQLLLIAFYPVFETRELINVYRH